MKITLTISLFIACILSSWGKSSNLLLPYHITNTFQLEKKKLIFFHSVNLKADAGRDTAICSGESIILRGGSNTPNVSYEWLSLSGLTLSQSQNYTATPSTSTYYVLKITNPLGDTDKDTVFIKVNPLPNITLSVSTPDTICNQVIPTFKAKGANVYNWSSFPSIAGSALSSRTGDSVVLYTILLPAPKYTFTVEGSDINGCKNTAQKTLVIVPLPSVTIMPVRDALCTTDQAIKLTVTPANIGRFYVEDTLGRSIPNVVVNSMFDPSKTGIGKFTVYYEVINENGCKSNPAIEINVKSCRVCTTPDSTKQFIKSCDPSTIGTLTKSLKNQFGCDSIVIINTSLVQSDTTYSFSTSCNPSDTGMFERKLKNIYGCDSLIFTKISLISADTTRLNLTSCDPSVSGISTRLLKNKFGCDSVVITHTTLVKSDTTYSVSTSCNPMDTGVFKRTLRSFSGCDSLIISTVSLSNADTTRLNLTSCDPSVSGISTRLLKNKFGCDSVVITHTTLVKSDTTYSVSTSCNPMDTGVFKRTLRSFSGCDSLIISTVSLSNADTTRLNLTSCDPSVSGISTRLLKNKFGCDSVVITHTTLAKSDTTYSVSTSCNPAQVGRSVRRLIGLKGCDSFVVTDTRLIPSSMITTLKIQKNISCNQKNDGAIELQSLNGGTPQYNLMWNTGDTNRVITQLKAGVYTLTVTDAAGCPKIDSVTIAEPLPITLDAKGIQALCEGDLFGAIRLNTVLGGTPPYRFQINEQMQSFNSLPLTVNNVRIGQYTLKISDANNCNQDTTISVNDGRKLIVDLGSDLTIDLGDSTEINIISNYPAKTIKWLPEIDVNCSNCSSNIVSPSKTTTYTINITDSLGCQASDRITINVDKKRRVFIPDSFSPNADGTNDILMIYAGKGVKSIKKFQIFNRWGNRVFEAHEFLPNDIQYAWDGTFQGVQLQPDLYVYYAIIDFIDGKTEIMQGNINLMR